MGREEQVRDAKCTRPSLPVEGLAPRLGPEGPFHNSILSKLHLVDLHFINFAIW